MMPSPERPTDGGSQADVHTSPSDDEVTPIFTDRDLGRNYQATSLHTHVEDDEEHSPSAGGTHYGSSPAGGIPYGSSPASGGAPSYGGPSKSPPSSFKYGLTPPAATKAHHASSTSVHSAKSAKSASGGGAVATRRKASDPRTYGTTRRASDRSPRGRRSTLAADISTEEDDEAPGPDADAPEGARRERAKRRMRRWWRRTVDKYGSVELDNKGSVARDHLALERTFLAWLRTSLSFASIGIAITQLFRLNTTITDREGLVPDPDGNQGLLQLRQMGKPLGATFLSISIVVLLVGSRRYFESQYWIIRGKFPASRGSVILVTLVAVALIVGSLAVVLVVSPTEFEN